MDSFSDVSLHQNEVDACAAPLVSAGTTNPNSSSAISSVVQDNMDMDTALEELNVFGKLSLNNKEEKTVPNNPFWNFATLVPMWPSADFSLFGAAAAPPPPDLHQHDNDNWGDDGDGAVDGYCSEEDEEIPESNRSVSPDSTGDEDEERLQLGSVEVTAENWGGSDDDMDQDTYNAEIDDGN